MFRKKELVGKPKIMIDFLKEQICSGAYSSGYRLPAIRKLMQQFNISYGSVKRGIDYLSDAGLLEKRSKSGVYVQEKLFSNRHLSGKIALFFRTSPIDNKPMIYPTVFMGVQEEAERKNFSLSLNYFSFENISEESIKDISSESDGIILMAEYDTILEKLSIQIPIIGVCIHKTLCNTISLVDIDPFQVAELSVSYFEKKGIKKVVIITDNLEIPAYMNRAKQFVFLWEGNGYQVDYLKNGKSLQLSSNTGYLFTTSSLLQLHSVKTEKKTGKILSEQAVVLGIDGKNIINPEFHNAPAINLDWKEVGKVAFQECLDRINTPGSLPKRIYLPGHLVE